MNNIQLCHIPKTGGTSVYQTYPECKFEDFYKRQGCNGFSNGHDPEFFEKYIEETDYFCVIRDPIDRFISGISDARTYSNADFQTTVDIVISELKESPHCFDNHFDPQWKFAKLCKYKIKFGDWESIGKLLCKYGYTYKEFKHANKGINENYYLTREQLKFVSEYYAKDFSLYYGMLDQETNSDTFYFP